MIRGSSALARSRHPRSHFLSFGGRRGASPATTSTSGSAGPSAPVSSSTSPASPLAVKSSDGQPRSGRHAALASRVTASSVQVLRRGPRGTMGSATSSVVTQEHAFSTSTKPDDVLEAEVISEEQAEALGVSEHAGARKVATDIPVDDDHLNKLRQSLDQAQHAKASGEGVTAPPSHETLKGKAETEGFQAETRKLLDIVAHSLYTDKEVFVRELISNASDALEKLRYAQKIGELSGGSAPLSINIFADPKTSTLVIQDTGVGMTKDEMKLNLGSIGRSGSLEFIKSLEQQAGSGGSASQLTDVIGKFGVGFYSVFMVSHDVKVFSRSARSNDESGWCWSSDGSGTYKLQEADGVERGTKIVIKLDGAASKDFSNRENIERVIKKYSNFVGFDINVNGSKVNTVRALWTLSPSEVSEDQHKEFYQFISHAYNAPRYKLMYAADAPLHIRSLLYVGMSHDEKFGMGRMDAGVSLFSRKVLIQHKSGALLPDWLRFVKGVVDSEDLPLNLSREQFQDSSLIRKLNTVLTRRILRWLADEAKRDADSYNSFFRDFGFFLKEGACADPSYREELAKLMRFESSATGSGGATGFDEYLERAPETQQDIFYVVAPNRDLAEASPYYESFKANGTEVLFLYTPIDDFVMTNVNKYKNKRLLSIEASDAKPASAASPNEDSDAKKVEKEEWVAPFVSWMKDTLATKVSSVRTTDRLRDSPAIVVDHESGTFRRMMRHVDPERAAKQKLAKQQMEINPSHPIIQNLEKIRKANPDLAKLAAEQIFDNALVQAGLLDDARTMVPRMNQLLESALRSSSATKSD